MFCHDPLEALRLDSKNWGDQYCWYCQVPRFILGYGSANLDRFGALVNEVFKPRITAINGRLVKIEGILIYYYAMVSFRSRGHRVLIGHSAIGIFDTPVP